MTQRRYLVADIFVLFFIHSALGNGEARDHIRRTWLKAAKSFQVQKFVRTTYAVSHIWHFKSIEHYLLRSTSAYGRQDVPVRLAARFLVGSATAKDSRLAAAARVEAARHGDVLMYDAVDSYANLTIKTVMMLKYLTEGDVRAHYIVKVAQSLPVISEK